MAPPRRGSSQQQQQLPSRRLLTFAALALLAHGVAAQQRTPPNNPSSPAKTTCPRSDGSVYEIGGYPSSPYVITPFADEYRDPVEGQVAGKACRWVGMGCAGWPAGRRGWGVGGRIRRSGVG